jgi:hypothetical protein
MLPFSPGAKILGTSSEFSKLLMSSKNNSSLICQIVNMSHSVTIIYKYSYVSHASYNNTNMSYISLAAERTIKTLISQQRKTEVPKLA